MSATRITPGALSNLRGQVACPAEHSAARVLSKWAAEMAAAAVKAPKPPGLQTASPKRPISNDTSSYVPSFINNSSAASQRASGDRLDANATQSMPT